MLYAKQKLYRPLREKPLAPRRTVCAGCDELKLCLNIRKAWLCEECLKPNDNDN